MARHKDAKERRRMKRKKRHKEFQRFKSLPKSRLYSHTLPMHSCYVNRTWREKGMATLLVIRTLRPGTYVSGTFSIDVWAMGLKDSFGRSDMTGSELDSFLERFRKHEEGVDPCDESLAQNLLWGGIAWSRENHFRLPEGYQRYMGILPPLPEGQKPDMSLFGKDGKVVLICEEQDFKKRYLGGAKWEKKNMPYPWDDTETSVRKEVAGLMERYDPWAWKNGFNPHNDRKLVQEIAERFVEKVFEIMENDEGEEAILSDLLKRVVGEVLQDHSRKIVLETPSIDNTGIPEGVKGFTQYMLIDGGKAFGETAPMEKSPSGASPDTPRIIVP